MSSVLRVSQTPINGCWVVETSLFEDMRGTFVEGWNRDAFLEVGLPIEWPQDNISTSRKNVLRGLHIQKKNPQGKLVRCIEGAVMDFCLDLRASSPTFLKYHMERLEGGKSLYCPAGTAHGFLALEDRSVLFYKCTTLYDRETDGGVNFFDPDIGCHWPNTWKAMGLNLIQSEKDKNLPGIREWLAQGGIL